MDRKLDTDKINEEEHAFSADRPIRFLQEDELNRSKFSQELAKSIYKWNEKDSLILSVYGEWGEGKSSVKNMIKDSFSTLENNSSPILLEFNPWQWSGEQHITDVFFKEISKKLRSSQDEKQKKIAKKLEDYAEYLDIGNEIAEEVRLLIQKILILISGGSVVLSTIVSTNVKNWLSFVALLCLIITYGLKEVIWFIKIIERLFRVSSKNDKNLDERKSELIELLLGMEKTLVIFLDDIDRLTKDEIKSLFRVVKANADFPQIVYIAFFQRDIVERSLDEEGVYKGQDYLKKIVQVGFDLPKAPITDIHKFLFKELDRLLGETELNEKFEKKRWREIFHEGIGDYFNNLRDVKRFISAFSFHLGLLRKKSSYEVNFVDLIGLEVLKQFEPPIYQKIFFERKLLTSSAESSLSDSEKKEEKRLMISILERSSKNKREQVKAIIKVLFPNSQWAWGSNYYVQVNDDDYVNHRINHKDNFYRYFSLFLPEDSLSQTDFDYAVSISGDEKAFMSYLMNIYEQKRLPLFLKKFEAYKQVVSKENAMPFITVMLKIGDLLSDENEGFFDISPIGNVERIIHWYLKKQEFGEEKQKIYKEVLEKSDAIYLPIHLLWDEYERRSEEKYPDMYILAKDDREHIKNILLNKIENIKDSTSFEGNIHLPYLLYVWKKIDSNNAQKWIDKYIENDMNLLSFLILLESKSHHYSGYETTIKHHIRLNMLKELLTDVETIFARVKGIQKKLNNPDEKTKRVFLNIESAKKEFHQSTDDQLKVDATK